MTVRSDGLTSDFAKIDETPISDEAYDEIPEMTDDMFARAVWRVEGRPVSRPGGPYPRIVQDADAMMGKPVIRGTQVTVEILLRLLGSGLSVDQVVAEYPGLTREDVLTAQAFAADYLARAYRNAVAAE